jgi:hypothetical protein
MKSVALQSPDEHFAFQIPDYGLDHQGGAIVDIFVDFDFIPDVGATDPYAYPEFVSVVNAIKGYLTAYPNETDFWEILNRNLVTELLTQPIPTTFGVEYQLDQVLEALNVNIAVSPGSSLVNFPRQSSVSGAPKGGGIDFAEEFSFEIPDYGLDHQGGAIVDIQVDLDFKNDIAIDDPYAYPEFVSIVNFIKDYLVHYPNETDFWEILNRNLVTALLTQKIPTSFGVEYQLDEIVDALTVDIEVESGSSLVNYNRSSEVTGSPDAEGIDFDEAFSFEITDYGLDHQGGAIVDIQVDLDFKKDIAIDDPYAYPEFVSIVNFIKDYLVHYPNETDFWEILNKNLVTALLTKTIPTSFGVEYQLDELVDSVTVDIDVESGSSLVDYSRSSEVTGSPQATGIDFDESFSFEISDYGLDHQGGAVVDILVDLKFKEGIGLANPYDYPEFVSIVNFIKDYLVAYPNETDFWEILNKNLAEALLTQTIPTNFGVEYHLVDVVDTVSVDIQVQSGSSLVNFPRVSSVAQSVAIEAELTSLGADLFSISSTGSAPFLRVKLGGGAAGAVHDLAVFSVDDNQGRIAGLAPGQAGYTEAALARARTVLSALVESPSGFDQAALERSLGFDDGERIRFLLIPNDSLDTVRASGATDPAVLFGTPEALTITATGRGQYNLVWHDTSGRRAELDDLVVSIEASQTPGPLGSEIQDQPEAELLDLRSVDPAATVQARFQVFRDADFDNVVGFYAISDARGTIVDPLTGLSLQPGDARYAEVAVSSRIAQLDLTVADQATASFESLLQGGTLLAPFLVVNGTPEQWLDADRNNDPAVYFPFLAANADGVDHVRLLGNNSIGFEDLADGGDQDCNDLIMVVALTGV